MASQWQFAIETLRLQLRPMLPDDTDAIVQIFADPLATSDASFTREQAERWVLRNLDHQFRHGYGLFSVILKSEGLLIGDCGLEWMEMEGVKVTELGYDFRRQYWNKGYATEAATAVRDYSFQTLGLTQLVSLIRVGNHASQRVAQKVGMELLGEIIRYDRPYWKYGIEREVELSERSWTPPS